MNSVWGLESRVDVTSELKGFRGMLFILFASTVVLAIGLLFQRKSYTNSSLLPSEGRWPPAGMV